MSEGDSSVVSPNYKTPSFSTYENGALESTSKQFHTHRSLSENGRSNKSDSLKNQQRARSFGPDHRRSSSDDPCVCGPNLYGNVLGPTVDEPILFGLTTFLKMCDECPERDVTQKKEFSSSSQVSRDQSYSTKTTQSSSHRSVGTEVGSNFSSISGDSSGALGSRSTSVESGISKEVSTISTTSRGTQFSGISGEKSSGGIVNESESTETNLATDSNKIKSGSGISSDSSVPLPKCLALSSEATSTMREVISHHTDTSINGINEISPRILSDSTQTEKKEIIVNTVEYSQESGLNRSQHHEVDHQSSADHYHTTTHSRHTVSATPISHDTNHHPSEYDHHEKSSQHQYHEPLTHHHGVSHVVHEHPNSESHKTTSYEHPPCSNQVHEPHHSAQPLYHSTPKHEATDTYVPREDLHQSYVRGHSFNPSYLRQDMKRRVCSGTIACTCCACNINQRIQNHGLTLSGFTQTERQSSERFLQNHEPILSVSASDHKSRHQTIDHVSQKKSHHETHHAPSHSIPSHHQSHHDHHPSYQNLESGSHYSRHQLHHKHSNETGSQHIHDHHTSHHKCRCKTDHTQCHCCICKSSLSKIHDSVHSLSHRDPPGNHQIHSVSPHHSQHKNDSHSKDESSDHLGSKDKIHYPQPTNHHSMHRLHHKSSGKLGSKHEFHYSKSHHEPSSHHHHEPSADHHHSSHHSPHHTPRHEEPSSGHHHEPTAEHTDSHHSSHTHGHEVATGEKACHTDNRMSNCDCCMCKEIYNKLLREHHAKHPDHADHPHQEASHHANTTEDQMQDGNGKRLPHKVTYSPNIQNNHHGQGNDSHSEGHLHGKQHETHANKHFSHQHQHHSKTECLTRQYLIDQGINLTQHHFNMDDQKQLADQGTDARKQHVQINDNHSRNQGTDSEDFFDTLGVGTRMQSCRCNACIDAEIERLQALKQSALNCACVINTINKKSIQKCRKRPKESACECVSASVAFSQPKKKIRTCSLSCSNQETPKYFAPCPRANMQETAQCERGDCSQLPEVRYTITRISKFSNYTTFELMKSTSKQPKMCPSQVEGVFVLRNKK